MIKNYTFSSYSKILDIVIDGYYLWAIFQNIDNSITVEKVDSFKPDSQLFQINLNASITGVNSAKIIGDNLWLAVDSVDYFAVILTRSNPIGSNSYLSKPSGIDTTEYCTDIAESLIVSGTETVYALMSNTDNITLIRTDDEVPLDVITITESGYNLINGISIDSDGTNLWIGTNTSPANIVKYTENGSGGTWKSYTLNTGENSINKAHYDTNALWAVLNIAPSKLIKVIETSGVLSHTIYDFPSGSGVCKDLNKKGNYFYLTNPSGIVYKFDTIGLTFVEQDLLETSDLVKLTISQLFPYSYYTIYNSNKLILWDESLTKVISTDLRLRIIVQPILNTQLNWSRGFAILNTDLRVRATKENILATDLRLRTVADYNVIGMLGREEFVVKVDNIQLDDVNLKSINIILSVDVKNTAFFSLNRRHDAPNYTIDGIFSELIGGSSKNTVKIYFHEKELFSGWVTGITGNSEDETVNVTAEGEVNPVNFSEGVRWHIGTGVGSSVTYRGVRRAIIDLPITPLNEQIHPYHAITHNVDFNWALTSSQAKVDDNGGYFGISANLGTKKEQVIVQGVEYLNGWAAIESWKPKQNREYFFVVNATLDAPFTLSGAQYQIINKYIGTTLTLSDDLWEIADLNGVTAYWQRVYDEEETELGTYEIGGWPCQEISVDNGKYISHWRYEDKPDGLYKILDSSFDYKAYAKLIADDEYFKLTNTNGRTQRNMSSTVKITLDALLYYNLILLNRINLINTTTPDIYKNNDGWFPGTIKSISISSENMGVTLDINTFKSTPESFIVHGIGNVYYDKNNIHYIPPSLSGLPEVYLWKKLYQKWDVNSLGEVE